MVVGHSGVGKQLVAEYMVPSAPKKKVSTIHIRTIFLLSIVFLTFIINLVISVLAMVFAGVHADIETIFVRKAMIDFGIDVIKVIPYFVIV